MPGNGVLGNIHNQTSIIKTNQYIKELLRYTNVTGDIGSHTINIVENLFNEKLNRKGCTSEQAAILLKQLNIQCHI